MPATEKPKRKRKSNEPKPSQQDRDESAAPASGGLEVEKQREGTKIALPFADTPVIRRNKEMRAKSKTQHRRSSTSIRGRRASSLIESGTSNGTRFRTYSTKFTFQRTTAQLVRFTSFLSDSSHHSGQDDQVTDFEDDAAVPHADVETRDFYKHIEQSLPEPRRMKQALTWCATRALAEKAHGGSGDSRETFIAEAARHITEDLLKDYANKSEMSDWFSREDAAPTAIVKKPNPANVDNAKRLVQLEQEVDELQAQGRAWNSLLSPKPAGPDLSTDLASIDASALDPAQANILASLRPAKSDDAKCDESLEDITSRLRKINSSLEPQIDEFAYGIHRLSQYRAAAERVADKILGTTAQQLDARDREAKQVTGTSAVEARDVLSALAGALNERAR